MKIHGVNRHKVPAVQAACTQALRFPGTLVLTPNRVKYRHDRSDLLHSDSLLRIELETLIMRLVKVDRTTHGWIRIRGWKDITGGSL